MRPAPISDDKLPPGCRRIVLGPPDGDPTGKIRPVEMAVDKGPETGLLRFSARCVLEPGDLEALQAGGAVWVTFYGDHVVPFSVDVNS